MVVIRDGQRQPDFSLHHQNPKNLSCKKLNNQCHVNNVGILHHSDSEFAAVNGESQCQEIRTCLH